MIRLRASLFVILSVLLALSPVGMAGMGLAVGPGGVVVELCGSDPLVQVNLPGAPVAPGHDMDCPTCLVHHTTAVLPAFAGPTVPFTFQRAHAPRSPALAVVLPSVAGPQARAPPALI